MQRDKEAVKRAYTDQFNEANRLDRNGGTSKPTKLLKATTSGDFRRGVMFALKQHNKDGIRLEGSAAIRGIALGGWTKARIKLTVCEDFSDARWVESESGKVVVAGDDARYIQQAVAVKSRDDGRWRIDGHNGTETVEDFETASCNLGGV